MVAAVAEDMAVVVDTSVEAAAAGTSAVDTLWPPPPRLDTSRLDALWSDLDPVRTS
jgi:hypothetical protein